MSYPILLDVKNKNCLVVGGGKIALRKTKELLKNNAKVTVVSVDVLDEFKKLNIKLKLQKYNEKFLKNKFLVIAATNDKKLNEKICNEANKKNILCNSVNTRKNCNFMNMGYLKKRNFTIAVSSNGKNPKLTKKIKNVLKKVV